MVGFCMGAGSAVPFADAESDSERNTQSVADSIERAPRRIRKNV
jgi:hypothetical protein